MVYRINIILIFFFHIFYRPGRFREETQREGLSQQSGGRGTLDRNGKEKKQRKSPPTVSVAWNPGNSTGFDADTSKVGNVLESATTCTKKKKV